MVEAKILLAAVSQPFQWAPLHFVANEIESIRAVIPPHVPVDLLGDADRLEVKFDATPTTEAILQKLPGAAILHLACHGLQNRQNPLDSGFVMRDSMLTVAKLMALHLNKAFLAFLSACETAKGDESQPDQAIHLAATMLFAGFRSVVGTMWYVEVLFVTLARGPDDRLIGRWTILMGPLSLRPYTKSYIAQGQTCWIPTRSPTLWIWRSGSYERRGSPRVAGHLMCILEHDFGNGIKH